MGWLAHWCRDYRFSRARLLNSRDQLAGARAIHGLDIARPELRVFAGKWPEASGLLSNRMEQVKLGPQRIGHKSTTDQVELKTAPAR
jgi:hypothetical protein